ncbi:hypothetical protein [Methanococcus maripaludis]|uniref:Skp family chaperone for outer membrane proteins n=1 Tax=Methanococcus maripaludis TaxID=39152 RepID=A0A7J9PCQ1_METMI|nr:hypothetical protein [Methanococcus maripaludis]MBA2861025.1 Skp family chaperone for outer membrane proteins [Methanococcus maripaludis]
MSEDTGLEFEKFKMYKYIAYAVVGSSILILAFIVYFIRSDLTTILSNSIINLLSFALAFFAIILSAMFYFESVKTSNKFYNEVNSFIRDMHEKIGRMEERFGKDLEYIGKIQSDMNGLLNDKTQKLIDTEQSETELKDKIEKTENDVEKEKLKQELETKEREKEDLRREVKRLNEINSELKNTRNKLVHGDCDVIYPTRRYIVKINLTQNSMKKFETIKTEMFYILRKISKKVSYSYETDDPTHMKFLISSSLTPIEMIDMINDYMGNSSLKNIINKSDIRLSDVSGQQHYF